MANYLALEGLLLERLQPLTATWPTLRIDAARDLAGVRTQDQRLPALCVLYLGEGAISDNGGQGPQIEAEQRWGIIVAVRDLRDAQAGRATAGDLLGAVLDRLHGWKPAGLAAAPATLRGADLQPRGRGLFAPDLYLPGAQSG